MRTFGGFKSGEKFFYGEVREDAVHVLTKPYWIEIEPTGEAVKLADVDVDLAVAPSKLIAVGLNYADHIAEMKRTPLGTPLIWFKRRDGSAFSVSEEKGVRNFVTVVPR